MEGVHAIELWIIAFIQSLGPWLEGPMQALSVLGNEEFNLVAIPTIYWVMDSVLGMRMAVMLLLSTLGSAGLKMAFHSPRPYWISTQVQGLSGEISFGMPSTHAACAMAVWGVPFAKFRSAAVRAGFALLIFLIGVSRIYLGVHFISDVLVGWLIGGLILFAYLKYEAALIQRIRGLSLGRMILLAMLSALGMIAFYLLIHALSGGLSGWELPAAWVQNASAVHPDEILAPFDLNNAFTTAGTWFGMLAGVAWLYHRQGRLFDASGTPLQRLLRYFVGMVGVTILWYFLGQVFPRNPDVLSYTLRFIRYSLIGIWVSALAPVLFQRIGLARIRGDEQSIQPTQSYQP